MSWCGGTVRAACRQSSTTYSYIEIHAFNDEKLANMKGNIIFCFSLHSPAVQLCGLKVAYYSNIELLLLWTFIKLPFHTFLMPKFSFVDNTADLSSVLKIYCSRIVACCMISEKFENFIFFDGIY